MDPSWLKNSLVADPFLTILTRLLIDMSRLWTNTPHVLHGQPPPTAPRVQVLGSTSPFWLHRDPRSQRGSPTKMSQHLRGQPARLRLTHAEWTTGTVRSLTGLMHCWLVLLAHPHATSESTDHTSFRQLCHSSSRNHCCIGQHEQMRYHRCLRRSKQ